MNIPEFEPWEIDHVYHRLKQIELSGGKACGSGVCPVSLGDMTVGSNGCSICKKLFPEITYSTFERGGVVQFEFNHGNCPCGDDILKHMVVCRAKQAVDNYYNANGFTKET